MITNKDIRVENGNLILNGDKYPLASQAEIDVVKGDIDDLGDTIGDITQTGISGASVAAQLGSVHSLISMINDLPPVATTKPADIPTGIRIHFNIGSQTAGYPLGNALYVSIKIAESRCVQILFENGAATPEGKYRTVLNSTTWSDWKAF
jgi:hypothetical protein